MVELMRSNLTKAQDWQKRYYDVHHSNASYTIGNQVLLSTKHLNVSGDKKLLPCFIGPF